MFLSFWAFKAKIKFWYFENIFSQEFLVSQEVLSCLHVPPDLTLTLAPLFEFTKVSLWLIILHSLQPVQFSFNGCSIFFLISFRQRWYPRFCFSEMLRLIFLYISYSVSYLHLRCFIVFLCLMISSLILDGMCIPRQNFRLSLIKPCPVANRCDSFFEHD